MQMVLLLISSIALANNSNQVAQNRNSWNPGVYREIQEVPTTPKRDVLVKELEWDEVYSRSLPAIVRILSAESVCSGTLISADTVLTAYHCVRNSPEVSADLWYDPSTQKTKTRLDARLIRWDKKTDLALLKLEKPVDFTPMPLYAQPALKAGQKIATIGHPYGITPYEMGGLRSITQFAFTQGVVSTASEKGYLLDISVSPGNSGGPLISKEGQLAGVISSKVVKPLTGDLGMASTTEDVRKLLKDSDREPRWFHKSWSFNIILGGWWHWDAPFNNPPVDTKTYSYFGRYELMAFSTFLIGYENTPLEKKNELQSEAFRLGYKFMYSPRFPWAISIVPNLVWRESRIGGLKSNNTGVGVNIYTGPIVFNVDIVEGSIQTSLGLTIL